MGLFDRVSDALSTDESNNEPQQQSDSTGGAFDVPEWAVEDRVNVDRRTRIIIEHYDVEQHQAQAIAEKLKNEMEDTDGYSLDSIRYDLEEELDINDKLLHTIVWTEKASIETIDRVTSYLEQERGGELYKLQAAIDDRTHPVTREAVEQIEEESGVPLDELKQILTEKAEKYRDQGGTPERMDHWVPHERFRFSVTKRIEF
jgi:hypothetical protein